MTQRTLRIGYENRNRFQLGREYPFIKKDPSAIADYIVDWAEWLRADTIATSVWEVGSGLTKDSDSNTTTTTTVWLSGGLDGTEYEVSNTITTAGGRTDKRTFIVRVFDR